MFKTTRMTVYYGTRSEIRKSGFQNWAKVVLHVSPVAKKGDKEVLLTAFRHVATVWIDDYAADQMIELAKAVGTEVPSEEGAKSHGYVITGNDIPDGFDDAFALLGCEMHFKRHNFGKTMFKIKSDGTPLRDKSDRLITSDHINITYWTGGYAEDSATYLSEESCTARALAEWVELPDFSKINITSSDESNDESNDDNTDEEA